MMLSYFPRLLLLGLACFFLLNLALGGAIALLTPVLLRRAAEMRPRAGADLLLALRLAPAALAFAIVLLLCVPAYLIYEPLDTGEQPSPLAIGAGLSGILLWAVSAARAIRAAKRSAQYVKGCLETGSSVHLPGEDQPVCVLGTGTPTLLLAGVSRPKLIVSRETLSALTGDQLAAALRHERAHRASRDNLKRLLLLAVPGILPGWNGLRTLEREWVRLTEWAADDAAVAGDSAVSLSLAAALVQVARMGTVRQPQWLVTSPISGGEDLTSRVDRLLEPQVPRVPEAGNSRWTMAAAATIVCVGLAAPHGLLEGVHQAIEQLMR